MDSTFPRSKPDLAGKAALLCLLAAVLLVPAVQAQRRPGGDARMFKDKVSAHWFAENTRFWYRNQLAGGAKEFILVDAERGVRSLAFDHARLAQSLSKASGKEYASDKLPFETIEFVDDGKTVLFKVGSAAWKCVLANYELSAAKEEAAAPQKTKPQANVPRRSERNGDETPITFINRSNGDVELFWLDTDGGRQSYGKIPPGGERGQNTFAGHVWLATDAQGREVMLAQAEVDLGRVEITGEPIQVAAAPPTQQRRTGQGPGSRGDRSPDGDWTASVTANNIFVRGADGKEVQLSTDGRENLGYGRLSWSPDSKTLAAFRIENVERKEVYLVQSSPPGGGRAKLQTRGYDLPGDPFTKFELNLFDVVAAKQIKPEVERVDFGFPRLRWSRDGSSVSYQKVDRGHQRLRLIEVNAQTGAVRNLIDEQSQTFIWTAHVDDMGVGLTSWLDKTAEILHLSEKSGWRHLYLVDGKEGKVKNAITQGEWVFRGVEKVDEEARQIWFRASGVVAGQDPYLIHYGRVNFDGSGLVWLTEGHGNHSVQYSPDRKFIVDTYSRVDLPPVNELRRVADGKLVCKLEEADASATPGASAPTEVFVAKGRDGKTDIWGIICRPRDFDPKKKYPLVEDIYAGPHGSFVPKTFSTFPRYESLNQRGFIVVKIDGMGTANRSKAFQDVVWHNLKDGGFEDRILWMKAAAAKYPYIDVTRVGIYGTSAGGQNAAAAVLFHPEFYKAAVANCGCHDNRMDKASWNEQWMGYMAPEKLWQAGPDNWYANSSNIDNAHRLRGHLFLIVGELDTNVPPESTYRFADALIKAGKDFDLLTVPNGGHGAGGQYAARRREDFFVRHLMGTTPPNRNEAGR